MPILKLLHVFFLIVWIGNLLCLTRLLSYLAKEEVAVQQRLSQICKRIYLFLDLPSMILAILLGIILIFKTRFGASLGWFHMKVTFAAGLVICDLICGKWILSQQLGSFRYKILHLVTALILIGVLSSSFLVRNKEAEIRDFFANKSLVGMIVFP